MAATGKMEAIILAVDHGTSGVKTALVSESGKVIDNAFEKTPIHFFGGGAAEQDPDDWWKALVVTTRTLLSRNAKLKNRIEAVCVSSTFSSTVAVDERGHHLMNCMTWMDSRGAPYVQELTRGFPSVAGYGLGMLRKWIPKTAGGPTRSGKDDIAHVLFIKNEMPDIYDRTHKFLPSKDYFNLRLTGEFAASFDSIQLFWVTDTRNINNVKYDDDLIETLGIDRAKLPPLTSSTSVLGTLTNAAAKELGLSKSVRVVVGSPDHQSACVGSGAVRDFAGHLYVGTSSWVQCPVPFKKTDMLHSIASLPTAIPGRYYCANEQDIAGGCLSFIAESVIAPLLCAQGAEAPDDPYALLDELAAESSPGSGILIFTPWLNGERSPVDDNHLRGGWHNLAKTTTAADLVRSVLEGVAFNTRWNLKYVERFVGKKLEPLRMVGGGAKSDIWCQIFADVLDRTILRVENPIAANARGAALIASVGLGLTSFDRIPDLVPIAETFTPRSKHKPLYDELFGVFLKIHRANKGIYRRLNRNKSQA
jgi:xylulokinase